MHKVLLNLNGTRLGVVGDLDFLFAVWHCKKDEFRSSGRLMSLGYFKPENILVELDRGLKVIDPHASVKKLVYNRHLAKCFYNRSFSNSLIA